MQGERTEESIISALDRVYEHADKFDAVIIIRGGGATSELSSFDSYLLAANCAQFPLPVITGIGHERDDTVLDIVAHTRAKTPTAVAEFLIKRIQYTATDLLGIQDAIVNTIGSILSEESVLLSRLVTHFSYITKDRTKDQLNILKSITERIRSATNGLIQSEKHSIASKEQYINLISPENILKKGYTLTLKGNKIVKSSNQLKKGDKITNRFHDGEIKAEVE